MKYLGEDRAPQMNGIGLYLGADGNLYEWVEGVDESGRTGVIPKPKIRH